MIPHPAQSRPAIPHFPHHKLALGLALLLLMATRRGPCQTDPPQGSTTAVPAAKIFVQPHPGNNLSELHQSFGVQQLAQFPAIGGLEIVKVPPGTPVDELIARYQKSGLVRYVEPDHKVHVLLQPDDPYFANGTLWHMENTGQSGGIADADVDATDAWDVRTSADGIIVAVVDSGIRYTHQDLSANMWHNPGEVPGNFSDDDGNGYVDDVFGINTAAGNGNPNDDYGHGTHVAGIIGAKGFNGVGVAGVCWSIQLMACKFVDQQGNGWISDAVTCIDYARSKGAKVINFSWGDTDFTSQALYDAIAAARSAGIIVTAACGNESLNNDIYPLFPASYDLDNIVSVAATTRRDELAGFSCYGPTTVDLGAPGDEIFSCWNGGNSSYQYLAGTSMAAPMVAGACALVWSQHPSENYNQIIARILNNVDPLPELEGKCVSGGRLNVKKALDGVPPATVTVAASDNTATIGTSDTASFTLTRDGNTSGGLTVHFQFSGTAVKWDDYRRPEGDIPESLAIPAGQSSATLTILALTNSTGANPQTVVLTLQANGSYIVGSPNSATVTLASPPAPHIESIASVSSDGIVIRWSSFPGARYQVQDKSDLAASLWQDLSGVITATATTTSWTNNIAGVRQRYYIVKLMN